MHWSTSSIHPRLAEPFFFGLFCVFTSLLISGNHCQLLESFCYWLKHWLEMIPLSNTYCFTCMMWLPQAITSEYSINSSSAAWPDGGLQPFLLKGVHVMTLHHQSCQSLSTVKWMARFKWKASNKSLLNFYFRLLSWTWVLKTDPLRLSITCWCKLQLLESH